MDENCQKHILPLHVRYTNVEMVFIVRALREETPFPQNVSPNVSPTMV